MNGRARGPATSHDLTATEVEITVDGEALFAWASIRCQRIDRCRVPRFRTSPADDSPRGGFCFVGRCSDCLMMIDGQPGTMACRTLVRAGMRVETQHGLGHWESEAVS